MGWKLIYSTWKKGAVHLCSMCKKIQGDKEGFCGCQKHAHIHVPLRLNNSWGGCAELKVCHGVWGQPSRETHVYLMRRWWGGVHLEQERREGALVGRWRRCRARCRINSSGNAFYVPLVIGGLKSTPAGSCLSDWKRLQLQESGNRVGGGWRGGLLICFTQIGTYMWERISLTRTYLIYYDSSTTILNCATGLTMVRKMEKGINNYTQQPVPS